MIWAAAASVLLAACGSRAPEAPITAPQPNQDWPYAGGDRDGSYFSPLAQINAGNVSQLGFAWDYALGTTRGLEATPLVVNGVMYAVGNWGRVYALDAKSGRARWTYDPQVDGQWGRYACCDAVNRGLAMSRGVIYVGSLDGYLHAIDAASGRRIWRTDTLVGRDKRLPYTVSGTPLIAGDRVIIGNGGADFGVRGYVSAYALEDGHLLWRFFTVPHDPKLGPQEAPHLTAAVKTWDAQGEWQYGAGGTVWDGMAYDPEADLVFIGTGNASPYNFKQRSPSGGDNLYLASIIAIHRQSGEMAWHYQEAPGESWDYTATAKMTLANLKIAGRERKVLLQAPKNGFFYVLDRRSGEVISAKNYAYVNWTRGLDAQARPILNPAVDYNTDPKLISPGQGGAHNWQPMSYDSARGRVYIPIIDMPMVYVDTSRRRAGLIEGYFTVPGIPPEAYDPAGMAPLFGSLPSMEKLKSGYPTEPRSRGFLRAWDPVAQRLVWEQPTHSFWDGGVLSTAGNLVVQGDAAGFLNLYAADSGRLLGHLEIGTSIMAAPMTYRVDGEQYIAFMAGFGGGGGFTFNADTAAYQRGNAGRIVALKLGGGAVPLPPRRPEEPFLQPPPRRGSSAQITSGEVLYSRYCSRCHFFARGLLPDLRRASAGTHDIFPEIVLHGAYAPKGMGRFDDVLSPADAEDIQAYLIDQAWSAFESQRKTQ